MLSPALYLSSTTTTLTPTLAPVVCPLPAIVDLLPKPKSVLVPTANTLRSDLHVKL